MQDVTRVYACIYNMYIHVPHTYMCTSVQVGVKKNRYMYVWYPGTTYHKFFKNKNIFGSSTSFLLSTIFTDSESRQMTADSTFEGVGREYTKLPLTAPHPKRATSTHFSYCHHSFVNAI